MGKAKNLWFVKLLLLSIHSLMELLFLSLIYIVRAKLYVVKVDSDSILRCYFGDCIPSNLRQNFDMSPRF